MTSKCPLHQTPPVVNNNISVHPLPALMKEVGFWQELNILFPTVSQHCFFFKSKCSKFLSSWTVRNPFSVLFLRTHLFWGVLLIHRVAKVCINCKTLKWLEKYQENGGKNPIILYIIIKENSSVTRESDKWFFHMMKNAIKTKSN